MSRNLKALGLALLAVCALGAVAAQGASAAVTHTFTSSVNETVVTGENEPGTKDVFKAGAAPVECTSTKISGTNIGTSRDTVTVHPKYTGCTFFGVGATVTTGGCNYIFGSDTTTSSHFPGEEHAAVSVECEAGHDISIVSSGCTLTIQAEHNGVPVNQGLHGVTYSTVLHNNIDSLTVKSTVRTIHYTAIGAACNLVGIAPGTYTNGTYTGVATVTGYAEGTITGGSTTEGFTYNHGAQVPIQLTTP